MRNGKVVVIDDERMVRELFRQVLEARGFTVLIAECGEEGARLILEDDQVCGVVCDFDMPGLNGWQVWQMVRTTVEERAGKFVVCSGGPPETPLARRHYESLRRDPRIIFLAKPVSSEVLVLALGGEVGEERANL